MQNNNKVPPTPRPPRRRRGGWASSSHISFGECSYVFVFVGRFTGFFFDSCCLANFSFVAVSM